ncbi:hypothetical protein O6H91_18G058100 [Diphasiastrum complanatum]|uniref:Uncharacterized protein n=1 Tax=Diphasiastrum complanatum TaxID=34168 RepID=A0ACC2B1M8_DIPCM|nr:hypothetical protein O6H91_18G058100 [Diphasiastrum complanatum]
MGMAVGSQPPLDLRSLVKSHSLFFDKLVELIPAKFYLAADDNNTQTNGMSKAEKSAARKRTRENLKKARRNNLDPQKYTSTLQLVQHKDKVVLVSESTGAGLEVLKVPDSGLKLKRAVTYEELQEKLRKRIEMLRAKRHADISAAAAKSARSWQDQKKKEAQQQKRKAASSNHNLQIKRQKGDNQSIPVAQKTDSNGVGPAQLEFSRVKIDPYAAGQNGRHKRRKDSKESLLEKATKLQADIQDPEKGMEVASKHSWNAAVSRAAGEKVLDNPKLIKRSLRREKQQRQKSAQNWQDRKDFEKKNADAKQQNRKEHIMQRHEAVKERKIMKRDKKLSRPGFEGRKEGFINT